MTRRSMRGGLPVLLLTFMMVSAAGCAGADALGPCNERYDAGEYQAAADCYREVGARSAGDARLYFNLGNAELRAGNVGAAVAAYRSAQLLAPNDPDTAANLATARALVTDDLPEPDPPAARKVLMFWADGMGLGNLVTVTLLLWALSFLLGGVRVLEPRLPAWLPAVCIGLTVAFGAATAWRLLEQRYAPTAVVAAEQVEAMSGRDRMAVPLFRLHEGAELRVREQVGPWLRVELSNGYQAWLKKDDLHIVTVW